MTDVYKNGQHRLDLEASGKANLRRKIFLDTETTGMSRYDDRIVEICAIEVDSALQITDSFHAYINPERDVPWFVRKIHGLTNEFLADKPVFSEVARDFCLFIKGAELYAHNMPFDSGMLNAELRRNGLPALEECGCSLNCTVQMARRLLPGEKHSLDALLDRFAIDRSDRRLHGAMIDTRLLVEVYRRLCLLRG